MYYTTTDDACLSPQKPITVIDLPIGWKKTCDEERQCRQRETHQKDWPQTLTDVLNVGLVRPEL